MALTVIAILIVLGCVLCHCVLVFVQTDNYVFLWKFFINKKRIIVVEGQNECAICRDMKVMCHDMRCNIFIHNETILSSIHMVEKTHP